MITLAALLFPLWEESLGTAYAQKVTFYSPEFEEGVRLHVGLSENDDVLQSQMDTITTISLAGLGITDIRDVVYMPNVKHLDLSYNMLDDVSALLALESLRSVGLKCNNLEDISILSFMKIDSLKVDISNNYINDFSCFFSPTISTFTFVGMGTQMVRNAPFFIVNHFYADVEGGEAVVNYRGYTNMAEASYVECVSSRVTAVMNGDYQTVAIPGKPFATEKVYIANGVQGDTTYVVPPTDYVVEAGETVTLATGLPKDYYLSYAYIESGTVEIEGNNLKYTAPETKRLGVIYFCYYQGSKLKGFSRFYINRDMKGDANGDGEFDLVDVVAMINNILGKPSSRFIPEAADMNDNGEVEIFDVMKVVNLVLNNKTTARSMARSAKDTEEKAIVTATSDGILLGINDPARFTAFQFDVEVADGIELTDARLTANTGNHTLRFVKNGQNSYRVVGISMNNSTFSANGNDLVELLFSEGGRVQINNIFFVTPEEYKVHFANSDVVVSGINSIEDEQEAEEIYDLSGRKVDAERKSLTKGIYIIGNKKIVIK